MRQVLGWVLVGVAAAVVFFSRQLGALPGVPSWMNPWGWVVLALGLLVAGRLLRAAARRDAEPPTG